MAPEQQWDDAVEAAWRGFRRRLADAVSGLGDDDVLVAEFERAEDVGWVEVCLNGEDEILMHACERVDFATFPRAHVDEVAVRCVAWLREMFGVLHPSFLEVEGLDDEAPAPAPDLAPSSDAETRRVRSHDDLVELVDAAMRQVFPDLKKDDDGDIPIETGLHVVFVRALESRPSVEVFAEVLVDPGDRDRLATEVSLLNAEVPLWKFFAHDGGVTMSYEMPAIPFSPDLLRFVTRLALVQVEEIASNLIARCGGRRFLAPRPEQPEFDVDPEDGWVADADDTPPRRVVATRSVQPSLLSDADAGEQSLDLDWSG